MGGYQLLPYYDAVSQQKELEHLLVRDERHAAFIADSYARVTNRLAVVDATLGPGATNVVSGAAESLAASVPVLFLTGEVNAAISGRSATQETDQFAMLRPAMKLAIQVHRGDRIPELLRRAVLTATDGRAGPVLIDVPEDVAHGKYVFDEGEFAQESDLCKLGRIRSRASGGSVEKCVQLLKCARRPVIIAGGGVHLSGAYDEVAALATEFQIPVATTISGKGAIDEYHAMALGVCGRFARTANEVIRDADLVFAIGCKLGEIATDRWSVLPRPVNFVHVDVDGTEIGKIQSVSVGLRGDARETLSDILDAMRVERGGWKWHDAGYPTEVELGVKQWTEQAESRRRSSEKPISVARVLSELEQSLPDGAIVVADGGFAAHWSAILLSVHQGRTYIANRGQASIGYGLPGAIGASLGAGRERSIVALCGDNGFAMALAELETARRAGCRILVIVLNNGTLGYVKALQHSLYSGRYQSVDFLEVDFAAAAEAFGCAAWRVDDPSRLGGSLQEALTHDGIGVMDVRITTDPRYMLPGVDRRSVATGLVT